MASELADRVLAGFRTWKERHEERVHAARDEFLSKSGVVGSWEKDVQKLNSVSLLKGDREPINSCELPIRQSHELLMIARMSKSSP